MFDDEMLDAFVEEMRDYDDEKFIQELIEFHRGDYDTVDYTDIGSDSHYYLGNY